MAAAPEPLPARTMLDELAAALAPHGLILRGGFHPVATDGLPADGGTLLMVGNAGGAMWQAFSRERDAAKNPLDRWTKRVVDPIATRFSALALYSFGEPHSPFQRWAQRAEAVHPSPLGILIHPQFGLWHAWRAALLFDDRLELPPRRDEPSPCESCREKPCLSACPVGAFTIAGYDVAACAAHIVTHDATCLDAGCHARNACPIGESFRYPPEQIRFHMAAFARARP
jgi:hypothetical protein